MFGRRLVAVTHSQLIPAGHDFGEPPWVAGLMIEADADSDLRAELGEGGAE